VFVVSRAGLVATNTPWQLGVPRDLDEAPLDFCLPSGRRRSVQRVPFHLGLPGAGVFLDDISCLVSRLGSLDGGSPRYQERVPRKRQRKVLQAVVVSDVYIVMRE
jgi:hypothetical protein